MTGGLVLAPMVLEETGPALDHMRGESLALILDPVNVPARKKAWTKIGRPTQGLDQPQVVQSVPENPAHVLLHPGTKSDTTALRMETRGKWMWQTTKTN